MSGFSARQKTNSLTTGIHSSFSRTSFTFRNAAFLSKFPGGIDHVVQNNMAAVYVNCCVNREKTERCQPVDALYWSREILKQHRHFLIFDPTWSAALKRKERGNLSSGSLITTEHTKLTQVHDCNASANTDSKSGPKKKYRRISQPLKTSVNQRIWSF